VNINEKVQQKCKRPESSPSHPSTKTQQGIDEEIWMGLRHWKRGSPNCQII